MVASVSFEMTTSLDAPGLQHYVVIPSAVVGTLLDEGELQAERVRDVSLGEDGSALARSAVACGVDYVAHAFRNLTVYVGSESWRTSNDENGTCDGSSTLPRCLSCPDIQVVLPALNTQLWPPPRPSFANTQEKT